MLVDSAFPSGGFAHSGGLEAAVQAGLYRGQDGVSEYARESLRQAASFSVPFLRRAYRGDLCAADAEFQACVAGNGVARSASLSQGKEFLLAACEAFGEESPEIGSILASLRARIGRGEIAGHWVVIVGFVGAQLDLTLEDVEQLFMFLVLRGILSAAVRLGEIGTFESQRILFRLLSRGDIEEALIAEHWRDTGDAAQTNPIIDTIQAGHLNLYSRLFRS